MKVQRRNRCCEANACWPDTIIIFLSITREEEENGSKWYAHCIFEFVTTGIGCGGGGLIRERGLQRPPFGYPPKRGLTKVYSLRFEGSNNNITKVKPLLSPSFLFWSSFLPSSSSLFFLQSVVLPLYIFFSVTLALARVNSVRDGGQANSIESRLLYIFSPKI